MEFGESSKRGALSKIRGLLKCSVCSDFMYYALYQCSNGHRVCSSCKEIVDECPFVSCRDEVSHTCLALEKMPELYQPQCKYQVFGCPEIIPYPTKLKHEEECDFRPYNCPWSEWGCSVIGDVPLLVSHLTNYHKDKIVNLSEFNFRFLINNIGLDEKGPWMVLNCFGEYFCLQGIAYSTRSPSIYITFLRFMGNPAEAENYGYKLEIERDGMKFTFEGTSISIRQGSAKDDDGLIWMEDMTPFFGGRKMSQELEVRGRIWKKNAS